MSSNLALSDKVQQTIARIEAGDRVKVSIEIVPGVVSTDAVAYMDAEGRFCAEAEVTHQKYGSYTATVRANDGNGFAKLLSDAIAAELPRKALGWLQGRYGRTPVLRRSFGGPFRTLKAPPKDEG